MFSKLFFLLAILLGLSLSAAASGVKRPTFKLQLRYSQNTLSVAGDPLVETACKGIGEFETECVFTLQKAEPHQKKNSSDLAFFALKFVEGHAVNISSDIKKFLTTPNLAPLLQSALSDCLEQYDPLDDLIEDVILAIQAKNYTDAKKFLAAAMTDIDECDAEFTDSDSAAKAEDKVGEDEQLAKNLREYNLFLKKMLSVAMNIIKEN